MGLFSLINNIFCTGDILLSFSDTVPGFFCSPYSDTALNRIISLKNRDKAKGFLILKRDISDICNIKPLHKAFMDSFWPGPLTIVFELKDKRLDAVSPDFRTIAVRNPSHSFWQAYFDLYDSPVLSTSANDFEEIYNKYLLKITAKYQRNSINSNSIDIDYDILWDMEICRKRFLLIKTKEEVEHILIEITSGEGAASEPSSIISLENNTLKIIREGRISSKELWDFFNNTRQC